MTDTFRAMCAELIEAVLSDDSHIDCIQIARRARALLAEPEAEGPSDEELLDLADDLDLDRFEGERYDYSGTVIKEGCWELDFARAVPARWGRQPAPAADGDVAEVAAWLRLFCSEEYESRSLDPDAAWLTRAAELLEQHHPAPPANGEVVELVEWLRRICFDVAPCDADAITRAADLLETNALPTPEAND